MAKDYNMKALRGEKLNDEEFAAEMKKRGIDIPKNLLQTPKMNDFVIEKMYELNKAGLPEMVNPNTGRKYTVKEAEEAAKADMMRAKNTLKGLMKGK